MCDRYQIIDTNSLAFHSLGALSFLGDDMNGVQVRETHAGLFSSVAASESVGFHLV